MSIEARDMTIKELSEDYTRHISEIVNLQELVKYKQAVAEGLRNIVEELEAKSPGEETKLSLDSQQAYSDLLNYINEDAASVLSTGRQSIKKRKTRC